MLNFDLKLEEKKEEPECKGLVFRAHVSSYLSSHNSIEVRKSLRLLKRESCKGCGKCYWMFEYIQEDIYMVLSADYLEDIKDGAKYKLTIRAYGGSYEYPNEVDVEVDFREIKKDA